MLLVFAVSMPPWDPQMATRFLVASEAAAIPVLVLLNKADLVSGDQLASIVHQVRAVLLRGEQYFAAFPAVSLCTCLS